MDKQVKQYIRQVRAGLPCCREEREELMRPFLASLQAYLAERPDAGYEDLIEAFGTPEEMVAMLAEKLTRAERVRYARRKKLIRIVVGVAVALAVAWSIYVIWFAYFEVEVTQTIIIEE